MHVSDIEEETRDIDWFALDSEGFVGHFTTGGRGALPRSIASSAEDLKRVTDYFSKQISANTSSVISSGVELHVSLRDEAQRARYLEDFKRMACRGLFSFDFLQTSKRPTGYFLVAKPLIPLHVGGIREDIRQVLERTVFERIAFRQIDDPIPEAEGW